MNRPHAKWGEPISGATTFHENVSSCTSKSGKVLIAQSQEIRCAQVCFYFLHVYRQCQTVKPSKGSKPRCPSDCMVMMREPTAEKRYWWCPGFPQQPRYNCHVYKQHRVQQRGSKCYRFHVSPIVWHTELANIVAVAFRPNCLPPVFAGYI